ncbi:MAG: hypothetical protein JNK72_10185 [Myxococcales bacterium]|nr:hypothetical protein [Myxococcales bacterium]
MGSGPSGDKSLLATSRYALGAAHPNVGLGECRDAVDTARGDRLVWWHRYVGAEAIDGARDAEFAERVARLGHPNVLPVLDQGRWHGAPFVITERPEGQGLARWLAPHLADGTWPAIDDVRVLFDRVCQAVAAAHRDRHEGVSLHAMLSPRSIFVSQTADGLQAQVFDFGLVQWLGARCPLAEGFADARAPEQRDDPEAVAPAVDVFALGVLLVTLLAPHENARTGRVWAELSRRGGPELRGALTGLRRDLPEAVMLELQRALSFAPGERHPDADRLRTALRRADWSPAAEPPPPRQLRGSTTVSSHTPARNTALPSAMLAEPASAPMTLRKSPEQAAPRAPTPVASPAVAAPMLEAPNTSPSVFIPHDVDTTRPVRSFAEALGPTEVLPPERTSTDLLVLGERDAPPTDGTTVVRTFAVGADPTVVTDPQNVGPYGQNAPRGRPAQAPAPSRPRTLPPARRPMALGTASAALSGREGAALSAAAARTSLPPPPREKTPRVGTVAPRPAPMPLASAERTAGVDLFAVGIRPAPEARSRTMALGMPAHGVENTPVSVDLSALTGAPPADDLFASPPVDDDAPRWTPAPTEALGALHDAALPLPLTELSAVEAVRGESLSPMWRAAPPSADPVQTGGVMFAEAPVEAPPTAASRWRDPRFLAALGFVAALIAFLLGLFVMGPSPS